jgi:hypothetical protein
VKNEFLSQQNHREPYIPIEEEKGSLFGKMEGATPILGDIEAPIDEIWDASR